MAVLGQGENEVYVSPHIEQMLGYSQKEWLSDPFLWYYRLHPDDRALWNEEFARGCRTGGPFRAECRFLARDGRVVWVHGHARVVKDSQGRLQFLQGVAFDITESKQAQKVLLDHAVTKARRDEEFEIARRVQRSLVPIDPKLDGLDLSVTMVSADEVGGDYYDVRPVDSGGWIAIGDVSGHGLNAGLVMLMLESAMSTVQLALPECSASMALSIVNKVLFENVAHRMQRREYVTLMLLRYHRDGRVVFAGGHQDIVICRAADGAIEWVRTSGPWMAIESNLDPFADEVTRLADGDLMILYTDGIIEARNAEGELFDVARLCDVIRETRLLPAVEIRDAILGRVRAFMHVQEDDMTVLVARYRAA
jgi:PAS domain S-box-containing protein